MTRSRTYNDAIALLNTCQSNAAVIEAIRKSGGRLNDFAIPEMHDYLRRIGYQPNDLNRLNVVHITGTKGKGSTSAFTEKILRTHLPGKIGLYTSPHLCAVRERIRINGEPLSEDLFAKYFFEVWERLEADPKTLTEHTPKFPIYFRLLTLLAFHTFLSLNVTATVLEVGIGGTYDSTNIVPKPIVTGVTSLGLDHTAVLGNTIEEIARNKAGIYKAGVPALSVKQDYEAGEKVLRDYAEKVGAPFTVVPTIEDIPLGLPGTHQKINASLAIALSKSFLETQNHPLPPTQSTIPPSFLPALASAKWPGRCQTVPSPTHSNVTWYLDGAHTTESLRSCGQWAFSSSKTDSNSNSKAVNGSEKIEKGRRPNVLVFNCSGGRAGESLLGELLRAGAEAGGFDRKELGMSFESVIFCTNVTYTDGHFKGDLTSAAIDPNDLSQLLTQNQLREAWLTLNPGFPADKVHAVASIQHAVNIVYGLAGSSGEVAPTLTEAQMDAQKKEVGVLVAGSLHLVGGVMEVAGLQGFLGMD